MKEFREGFMEPIKAILSVSPKALGEFTFAVVFGIALTILLLGLCSLPHLLG